MKPATKQQPKQTRSLRSVFLTFIPMMQLRTVSTQAVGTGGYVLSPGELQNCTKEVIDSFCLSYDILYAEEKVGRLTQASDLRTYNHFADYDFDVAADVVDFLNSVQVKPLFTIDGPTHLCRTTITENLNSIFENAYYELEIENFALDHNFEACFAFMKQYADLASKHQPYWDNPKKIIDSGFESLASILGFILAIVVGTVLYDDRMYYLERLQHRLAILSEWSKRKLHNLQNTSATGYPRQEPAGPQAIEDPHEDTELENINSLEATNKAQAKSNLTETGPSTSFFARATQLFSSSKPNYQPQSQIEAIERPPLLTGFQQQRANDAFDLLQRTVTDNLIEFDQARPRSSDSTP